MLRSALIAYQSFTEPKNRRHLLLPRCLHRLGLGLRRLLFDAQNGEFPTINSTSQSEWSLKVSHFSEILPPLWWGSSEQETWRWQRWRGTNPSALLGHHQESELLPLVPFFGYLEFYFKSFALVSIDLAAALLHLAQFLLHAVHLSGLFAGC